MDMETGSPDLPGTPLLLRLERLEHQVAAWENGQPLPLNSPSSNVTGETRWSEPSTPGSLERRCRPARSALEEVEEKGTVLKRVSLLEQRVSLVSRTLFSSRELLLSSPLPAHVDGEAGSPGAAREEATLALNPAGEPVPTPQELGKLPQQENAPPASDILNPERPEKGQQKEPEDLTGASYPGSRPKEKENSEKENNEQEREKKEQERETKEQEQETKEQERETKEQEQETKEQERETKEQERETKEQEREKKEQEREKKEQEREKKEQERETKEQERETKEQERETKEQERETKEQERETEEEEQLKREQEKEKKEQETRYEDAKSAVEARKLAKARPWSKRLRKYLGRGCVSHDSILNRSAAEQTRTTAH